MNTPQTDPYKALGVEIDADASAIKTAYRKLVLKCHPDKVQDPALKAAKQDEFQRVQQAYEVLSDETKRREYDDDVRLRKLREKFVRSMTTPSPSSPKEYNVRTEEPPPSFKPGPPPSSPFATYTSGGSPQFSHSWDIPHRAKKTYDEEARTRPREDPRDERRRRKDYEPQTTTREYVRDKDHDKKPRADRDKSDKDDKRDRSKRDQEKREKEKMHDRARHAEQQEKASRMRRPTPSFGDGYNDHGGDYFQSKKKTSAASPAAAATSSGASSKRNTASPQRERSARRAGSPFPVTEPNGDKIQETMEAAAKYIKYIKSKKPALGMSSSTPTSEEFKPSDIFPDPDIAWSGPSETRRQQRSSEKFNVTVEPEDPDIADFMGSSSSAPRKPRLNKTHTSPIGLDRMQSSPSSSSPRYPPAPGLSRSATMDHPRFSAAVPPAVPHVPYLESSRHSSKSDRRRRGSADMYDDARAHRVSSHSRSTRYAEMDNDTPRTKSSRQYPDTNYYYPSTQGDMDSRVYGSPKVSSRAYSREPMPQARHFAPEEVKYTNLPHSSHYTPHYAY